MTWRDELRPASYRGVGFLLRDVEGDYGRRIARHEYPTRDLPWHEDMGRKAREITVQGYVLEPDHIAKAKNLIDACERSGPATLVHPWHGEMLAVVTRCSVKYSHDFGGMATFEFIFTESGEQRYPAASENAVAAIDSTSLAAAQAALEEDAAAIDPTMPDYGLDDISSSTTQFVEDVKGALGDIASEATTYAEWIRSANNTLREASALSRDPFALGEKVFGLLDIGNVSGIRRFVQWGLGAALGGGSGPIPNWRSFLDLTNWTPQLPSIPVTTSNRVKQQASRNGFVKLVRQAATQQAARAAVRNTFDTADDALEARDTISDLLDEQATAATTDANYRATMALRAKVIKVLGARAPQLPKLVSYTPRATIPSLVVAHLIYGDDPDSVIQREADIVARNRVRHPLFVPGGTELQVITVL